MSDRTRQYQDAALRASKTKRFFILLWRRQAGKSTTFSKIALFQMMKFPGRLVTYASASLLLGREIIFKESQVLRSSIDDLIATAKESQMDLQVADRDTGVIQEILSDDDFADLFEAQRLEFRLYHDKTVFSRTQVIAPSAATARGWTGTVMVDEFGFIRDLQDLMEALEPIVSTDPQFKLLMATTPPKDDAHYSYEMTLPPPGMTFEPNPKGNWYRSEAGNIVHRVDIWDAAEAGVKLYDLESGAELTPQEHFAQAQDKDAHRRNYQLLHIVGGTSAINLLALDVAQRRGVGQCKCLEIEPERDWSEAVVWLLDHLGAGNIGLGYDVATTTKDSSNPSSLAIVERATSEILVRLVLVWKTKDPDVATHVIKTVIETISARRVGGRPKRLCVDATNERYFSTALRKALGSLVPVELVVGSESAPSPSSDGPMNMKEFLGAKYVEKIDNNQATLPPERYLKEDHRLVKKDRGMFVCVPDAQGRHGDTFDACKLGCWALESHSGAITDLTGVVIGHNARRARFVPRQLPFGSMEVAV